LTLRKWTRRMLPMTWTRSLLPMSSLLVRMKVLMKVLTRSLLPMSSLLVRMKVLLPMTRRLSRWPRLSEVGLTHKHI
jgi:hypothetical protein